MQALVFTKVNVRSQSIGLHCRPASPATLYQWVYAIPSATMQDVDNDQTVSPQEESLFVEEYVETGIEEGDNRGEKLRHFVLSAAPLDQATN